MEAVLSECRAEEHDSCATLARLKMAIEYEEKKVSNQTLAAHYKTTRCVAMPSLMAARWVSQNSGPIFRRFMDQSTQN